MAAVDLATAHSGRGKNAEDIVEVGTVSMPDDKRLVGWGMGWAGKVGCNWES